MTSQLAADLTAIRAVLSGPGKWTQLTAARNSAGGPVNIFSKSAVSFCLDGVIQNNVPFLDNRRRACRAILTTVCGRDFILWQDTSGRTFAEVLALLDKTIAAAEASDADR